MCVGSNPVHELVWLLLFVMFFFLFRIVLYEVEGEKGGGMEGVCVNEDVDGVKSRQQSDELAQEE